MIQSIAWRTGAHPLLARGVGLDEAHPRRRGLGDDHPDEGLDRGAGPGAGSPSPPSSSAIAEIAAGDDLLLGGAEAVELVFELVVEGRAGDAGGAQQVLDRGRLVALFAAGGHHRGEEALALLAARGVAIATPAGWQPALAESFGIAPGSLQHRGTIDHRVSIDVLTGTRLFTQDCGDR